MPSLDLEYSRCNEKERGVAVELHVCLLCVYVGLCDGVYMVDNILLFL